MRNGQRFDGYGDGRSSDANRRRVEALLQLFADFVQNPTQRDKREYTVGDAGIYIKTADTDHLTGPDVFWGAIRPGVNSDFRRRNAAEGKFGAWLFVSPAENEGLGQCWLIPAGLIEVMFDRWLARFGATREQLHLHVRATDDGRFHRRGCGEPIDVTEYHLVFPVDSSDAN